MSEELSKALVAAASTGEVIQIIYNGGSQPGSVRDVQPLEVTASEMRALDVATGIAKTFLLSKLELASPDTGARRYDADALGSFAEARTVQQAFQGRVAELEGRGWHVELTQDAIALQRGAKDESASRFGYMTLNFCEYETEDDWSTGSHVEVQRKAARPYRVRTLSMTRAFQRLAPAAVFFLSEASKHV